MKIKEIRIENFRSIKQLALNLKDLGMLIGENNSGKTNILMALELFFNGTLKNMREDFFNELGKEIAITITFDRLNDYELNKFSKYLVDGCLSVRRAFGYSTEKKEFLQPVFSGLVREPKPAYLKLSKFDEYKESLPQIFREHNLPEYFKTETGKVTQASYRDGIHRLKEENLQNRAFWDDAFFSSEQFFGWKEVAQAYFPEFLYVPAIRYIEEESRFANTTSFGKLAEAMLNKMGLDQDMMAQFAVNLAEIDTRLNRPSDSSLGDRRPSELKDLEKELTSTLAEYIPNATVLLRVLVPQIKDIIKSGTRIFLDDGVLTDVEAKGHGLQRAMIFTLFKVYADFLRKSPETNNPPSFIFAIEEPEIYLHPHLQRKMFEALATISEVDQVILCTHSPFFIDMSRYMSLIVTVKRSLAEGSEVFQCLEEIFPPQDKGHFKLLNDFDPTRNELFFAKKIVLVEGDSEKVAFRAIADKLGYSLDAHGISIVECSSKYNLRFFMKIQNKFRMPYVVVYDVDPGKDEERENAVIARELDRNLGKIETLDPDFDTLASITRAQIDKWGKPFATHRKFSELTVEQIPTRLKNIALSFFN